MRLPPVEFPAVSWSAQMLERWTVLAKKAATMEASVGNNDVYERTCAELHRMAQTLRFDALPEMLKRRITARTLTSLWLKNEVIELLNARLLTTMLRAQQPRLTPMTLRQLAQLYFRRFDWLDEKEGVRELLERSLLQQLDLIPPSKIQTSRADPLVTLKREGHWLLSLDGPRYLAERVRQGGRELGETLMELGLHGFDDGRYGDICRAHFYLETLRHLPLGESDPVLDELLKPTVAEAPFEGTRRIGHVALEILIDRAGQEPGEVWQNFILNLAGDPRISSTNERFVEWWRPLGEERIQKVRGWLSKEDLRLFLQAVEQYGLETANTEMQRMFPARKRFLEGLFKLKLIRNTRLLLGGKAQQSVKRILGKDVKTSFARMDGPMNDKAVIYLDCGDFHLVEGSHSFKIWVYLAAPGEALRTYERNTFSHYDLTTTVPGTYKKLYPGLPYDSFVHIPHVWQNKVFTLLAENGIALDIEQLLSPEDYRRQLSKFGIPAVNAKRTLVPAPANEGAKAVTRAPTAFQQGTEQAAAPMSRNADVPTPPRRSADVESVAANGAVRSSAVASGRDNPVPQQTKLPPFSSLQLAALRYLETHSRCGFYALLEAVSNQGGNALNVKTMLESSLSQYVQQDGEGHWLLSTHGEQLVAELARSEPSDASQSVPSAANMNANENAGSRVARLEPFALAVLRYFAANPGDKVRYAANVLADDDGMMDAQSIRYALTIGPEAGAQRLDMDRRLVLTTYQTLRDYQFSLCRIDWGMVIFDEAQNIKNPNALQTRAAKGLKADFKLLATGTPVENSLGDFWCLMDTAQPGLFGSWENYRDTWIKPILSAGEEERDEVRVRLGEQLRKTVGPFMLRRVKEDQLKGLPSKTIRSGVEQVDRGIQRYAPELGVSMRGIQLQVYDDVLDGYRARRASADDMRGSALAALTQLRSVSLHPRLDDEPSLYSRDGHHTRQLMSESGKLAVMLKLLDEIRDKGEKVILFMMTKRLQRVLKLWLDQIYGLDIAVINGDTKAVATKAEEMTRKKLISAFEAKSGFNLLIMSPVAAGVGLTVVGANHVVHLERHWNPAKEAQASDRVYRIGQQKEVFIHLPAVTHPQFDSFDVHLDRLLRGKLMLKDAVVTPEAVSESEMIYSMGL